MAHEVVVAMKEGNASGAKDLWARGASRWEQESDAVLTEPEIPTLARLCANVRRSERMSTIGLSSVLPFGRHRVYAAASNRIREIRPSGIIGGLWEPQAMEELGTHSTIGESLGSGNSLPAALCAQFLPDVQI